jgi:hypothetical protein
MSDIMFRHLEFGFSRVRNAAPHALPQRAAERRQTFVSGVAARYKEQAKVAFFANFNDVVDSAR